jgi:hypothetical protein
MCWFSVVNSETEVAQAEINQCLGIRLRLYACPTRRATNWIVPANQLSRPNPCPVCLPSGTTVIFHDLPERIRDPFGLPREVEAVFEMVKTGRQRLDVFRLEEGSELRLDQLTNGTRFTVTSLPSRDPLSAREWSAVEEIYQAALTRV